MSHPTGKTTTNSASRLTAIRLLIADDQPRVRHSLEALLTAQRWSTNCIEVMIEIVGEADDGHQAVAQVEALLPDVVVLDLPIYDVAKRALISEKLDGLSVIQTIKRRWPDVRIVFLTMYATDRFAILLAGADAFLLKGCPTEELLEAVIPVG
jgi:two-component system, LuxR family, secretion system response regulator SsrB